ncbi:MAG: DUF4202 domain-containing protein [Polyangiaceae bacterium]|nr:DUF4202 domain-containing protein [Polyangiaceae bacterium]
MIDSVILCVGPDFEPPGELEEVFLFSVMEAVLRVFPGVDLSVGGCARPPDREVTVAAVAWCRPDTDLFVFDRLIHAIEGRGSFSLRLDLENDCEAPRTALEILTRYQRLIPRLNASSKTPRFSRTLERHRLLFDISKPLIRADYDHAIDTWRWVLRLDPAATAPVQLAALFHDIERLVSEGDERIEHKSHDYHAFKNAHAKAGAELTRKLLSELHWNGATLARAVELVEKHERGTGDPELRLLNDADALSFFSLNSNGFLAYYGAAHTAQKVEYTLRRMRPAAREEICRIRLHPEVEQMAMSTLAALRAAAAAAAA